MSLSELLSRSWWSGAGQRALRTVLVAFVPFVPPILQGSTQAIWAALSTGALAAVLSIAWSFRSLPEVDGVPRPWWVAALERVLRTFAQALLANIPAVTLIQDVPWTVLLTNALASAIGSLILAAISALPETQPLAVPVDNVVQVVATDGTVVAGPASPLSTGTVIEQLSRADRASLEHLRGFLDDADPASSAITKALSQQA